jgi:sugar phosphate permease
MKNTYGYNQTDYAKFKKHAWLMLLSFGLTYMFFYNGRQNINLVKTDMAEFFGFFNADGSVNVAPIGVVSSALFWCYAFGQLISGRIGAIFGYKKVMCIGVAASAVLNIIISFQSNLLAIAVLWGLNGFFQAMVWSNGIGVINKWWPKEKRGFASGLATSFSGIAQVVTYLTINWCLILNPEWGWTAAFRFPMIPMALMLVAFILFFKEKPEDVGLQPFEEEDKAAAARDVALAAEIEKKGFLYPYKVLFSEPKVIVFCLISAIAGVGRYGLLSWMPTYFNESLGLEFKDSIAQIILLPAGQACAMFVFPFITDKVFKGKREPMLILASIVTFCVLLLFPFVKNTTLASALLLVVGISGMVTGVIWAIAGDMGGRAFASTVVGVLDWAVYMGAATQEAAFGYLKNTLGWSAIFITIGCLYIILLVLTLLARKMKMKNL